MTSTDSQLGKIITYAQYLADEFLNKRHVVACGVGFKTTKNLTTSEPCVVVSVNKKMHPNSLESSDIIPSRVDDIRTDVIQTGIIRGLASARTSRLRPVRPGISIGHPACTAGTLGCLVTRGGRQYILSANHVLANLNKAEIGDAILQPGTVDGGTQEDAVAVLASFVPMRFTDDMIPAPTTTKTGCLSLLGFIPKSSMASSPEHNSQDNYLDAALALPFPYEEISSGILDLGGAPTGIREPTLGMKVIKSGRTTGLTQGKILQTHLTIEIDYDGRKARFKDQAMLSGMSQPGDSGSLVLDQQRQAVALLFAGSSEVSVATPIKTILDTFDVQLVLED